jgi:hypothetical protein
MKKKKFYNIDWRIVADTDKKIEWMNRTVAAKKMDIINVLVQDL